METFKTDFNIEIFNAVTATISQGHFELYKCMKNKHESRACFRKNDLMYIYDNFARNISRKIRYQSDTELTDSQNYANAMSWFNGAIGLLARKGYLALGFKVEVE